LVTGQRKSVKILGAVELQRACFYYRRDSVFNAETYLGFLQPPAPHYRRRGAILIQDNASYHKGGQVWRWFDCNRRWLEVHQLPPTHPNSIQPNGSGNTPARTGRTTATSPPGLNSSEPCQKCSAKWNRTPT
jgi:hypothetical protein